MYTGFIRLDAVIHVFLQNGAFISHGKLILFYLIAVRNVIDRIPFHAVIGFLVKIPEQIDIEYKHKNIICLHGSPELIQLRPDLLIPAAFRDLIDLFSSRPACTVTVDHVRIPGELLRRKIALRCMSHLIGHLIVLLCDGIPVGDDTHRSCRCHDAHSGDAQAHNKFKSQPEPEAPFLLFLSCHHVLCLSFHFFHTSSRITPAA